LSRGEKEAFNEAYEAIQDELHALERLKQNVKDMAADPVVFTIPGGPEAGSIIHIQNVPIDRWQVCSPLLKLRESEIFLCERSIERTKEFAVIERFKGDSPYAQANTNAEVLMAGDDPVLLVEQYAAGAQRTLRTMASNLTAKAHKIVWQRYASTSPAASSWRLPTAASPLLHFNNSDNHKHLASVEPSRHSLAICP
jgi:hypothetical protein